jgi:uncharacterized protein YcbX
MKKYTLTQINIYPVKSLPGILLKESYVEERGLQFDRRWMLVDKKNCFITQRLFPQMIFIDVKIKDKNLVFNHHQKNLTPLNIDIGNTPSTEVEVRIWDDVCIAKIYDQEINEWFSQALDTTCSLVYMPNSIERKTSVKYYSGSKNVSFADGYPFLIIGEESLNFLNSKINIPIEMKNLRPNLVFSGGKPHDEDNWENIKIGEIKFSIVKPCARCVITTIDSKGKKNKEPLATLNTYRNFNDKIMFGQNALSHNIGKIKIGDPIILKNT